MGTGARFPVPPARHYKAGEYCSCPPISILALRDGVLPPTLNFENPDPMAEGLDLVGPENASARANTSCRTASAASMPASYSAGSEVPVGADQNPIRTPVSGLTRLSSRSRSRMASASPAGA